MTFAMSVALASCMSLLLRLVFTGRPVGRETEGNHEPRQRWV